MKTSRLLMLFALALTLILGTAAAEAAGQDTLGFPVSFKYEQPDTVDPGKFWVDEKGVHIRGRIDIGRISGDIEGSAVVVYNADFYSEANADADPSAEILPNSGVAYGKMEIYSDAYDGKPLWSGEWEHKIENGRVVGGSMIAYDQQGNQIMRLTSIMEAEDGSLVYSGTIETYCPARLCRAPLSK